MNIFTLLRHELHTLFITPLAWTIMAVVEAISAYLFLIQVDRFQLIQPRIAKLATAPGVTDLVIAPHYANVGILMLLATPLLTMRLISEERRQQTLTLLLSAPISGTEIILGKYLATLAFQLIIIALITLMPLSLLVGTDLDLGKLAASILALSLLAAAFTAIGLYCSTLTAQPAIAAVGTMGLLLLLWMIDWNGNHNDGPHILEYISMLRHYQQLLTGVIHSRDVSYFLLCIIVFNLLSIRRLDNERLIR